LLNRCCLLKRSTIDPSSPSHVSPTSRIGSCQAASNPTGSCCRACELLRVHRLDT
jgi:hypothetical protein